MDIEDKLKNVENFAKTDFGRGIFSSMSALFNASIYGTLGSAVIFIVMIKAIPSIDYYVAFFLSLPTGWITAFIVSYLIASNRLKKVTSDNDN